MRVHRLELTAFGPFPGTEVVDFDSLNDAGVFLLTGHTGAGKTSVLDAICFGLFGAVPGDRNNARDLRSHHAEPLAVPVVELEVTMRGRRFRLRRSPAWSRPSRRAKSGYVEQHAQARVSELVDGEWQPVSSRVDEASHLVTRVLGMSRDQFCQVVMLPQGQFQTFLKAGAKERHDVLEALFDTGRFARVEKWLTEQRRARERAYAAHEAHLAQLVARLDEVVDVPLLSDAVEPGWSAIAERAASLHVQTDGLLVEARAREEAAREHAKASQHALDEAKVLSERQSRHAEATRQLTELDAGADQLQARVEQVERAKAAQGVIPVVRRLDDARARHGATVDALEIAEASARQLAAVAGCHGAPDPPAWVEWLQARLHVLDELQSVERQVTALEREVADLQAQVAAGHVESAELADQLSDAPDLVDAARRELDSATALAAGANEAATRQAAAEVVVDAARGAAAVEAELTTLRGELRLAEDGARDTRERWLDIRERYLSGLAAILASDLTREQPCPVCGSPEHPDPAKPAADQASPADEAIALADRTRADHLVTDLRARLDRLTDRRATLAQQSGGLEVSEALQRLEDAKAAAAAALAAESELHRLRELATAVDAHVSRLTARRHELTGQVAAAEALLETRAEAAQTARERLAAELHDGAVLSEVVSATMAALDATRAWESASREAAADAASVAVRKRELADALVDSTFDTPEDVAAATLTKAELANAESLVRAAADQRAAVTHTLGLPELVEAAAVPAPDLAELEISADAAAAQLVEASTQAEQIGRRSARLAELAAELDAAVAALVPLAADRDVAIRVAAMCNGTSLDNQTRTRLSHYVLSSRLRQVVDAANVRLRQIAAGRYQLVHSMRRGVGDARGGLGLMALDTYTGVSRDPATLSGGETFYVSLALALGLADLVRDEIGGVELSTLFVDEGFGSLDSETLDEVMDELDSLRTGGRSVGIVSHLSELRQRIPTRLHVEAGTSGSTIRAR